MQERPLATTTNAITPATLYLDGTVRSQILGGIVTLFCLSKGLITSIS
jgi:hypothetical protein